MKKKNLFLHTPPGTKPLYMEEALLRNTIERKLCSYFERWSYQPVEPPMIDYFDIYTPFLTERQQKGSIRFVDRDGNLVLLRNDITLFAAKALAVRMGSRSSDEKFKYYYCGQIMRSREKDAPEEYYQIGCEIVSKQFTHEEFEIFKNIIYCSEKYVEEEKISNEELEMIGSPSFLKACILPIMREEENLCFDFDGNGYGFIVCSESAAEILREYLPNIPFVNHDEYIDFLQAPEEERKSIGKFLEERERNIDVSNAEEQGLG